MAGRGEKRGSEKHNCLFLLFFVTTFHFVCDPLPLRHANEMESKRKVFLYLVMPPQVAAVYSTNGIFCWRTTFRNPLAPGVTSVREERRSLRFQWF